MGVPMRWPFSNTDTLVFQIYFVFRTSPHSLTGLGPSVPLYLRLGSSGAAASTTLLYSTGPGRSLHRLGPSVPCYSRFGSSGGTATWGLRAAQPEVLVTTFGALARLGILDEQGRLWSSARPTR